MRDFLIDKLLELNVKDINKVYEYVDFCLNADNKIKIKNVTSHHHILPNCLFKEYAKLSKHKYNGSHLTYYQHYYAHFLFTEAINDESQLFAFCAMHFKDLKLKRISPDELISEDVFNQKMKERDLYSSIRNKNMVTAKSLSSGKILKVTKEEFENSDDLVGSTTGFGGEHLKGTISIIENGVVKRINKSEYTNQQTLLSGKIIVRDKENKNIIVRTDDERYLSGELVHINKGKKLKYPQKFYDFIKNRDISKSKNPSAKIIIIFNSDDEPIYYCNGNFLEVCKYNNLSYNLFARTYKNNSKIVFDFSKSRVCDITRIKNSTHYQYVGWYARKMKLITFNKN
jgi:hypothetical protein